jgi:Tol biopolymer transport system component
MMRCAAFSVAILVACGDDVGYGAGTDAPPGDAPAPDSSSDAPIIPDRRVAYITMSVGHLFLVDVPDFSVTRELAISQGSDIAAAYDSPALADGYPARCGFSPDGRRLAYLSGAFRRLYVADVGGADPSPPVLVSDGLPAFASVGDPAGEYPAFAYRWSPDSRWIVYRADSEMDEVYGLHLVAFPDGIPDTPRPIASSNVSFFSWSVTSERFEYISGADLYLGAIDGTAPQQADVSLTGEPLGWDTAFSPDGARLAFELWNGEFGSGQIRELWVADVNAGGAPERPHVPLTAGQSVTGFAWASDGRLAYALDELFVVDTHLPVPWTPVQLTTVADEIDVLSEKFRWSPDGRWIVLATHGTDNSHQLLLVRSDGSSPAVPLGDPPAFPFSAQFAFSPDGSRLVFSLDRQLFIMDVAGDVPGPPVPLSDASTSWAWSPDGSRLVYGSGPAIDPGALSLVDVSGGTPGPPIPVASGLAVQSTTWAPDSAGLLLRTGSSDLYTVDLRAAVPGEPQRVNLSGLPVQCAAWAPMTP